jgi:hypothetical protein
MAEFDHGAMENARRACQIANLGKEAASDIAVEEFKGAMNWVSTSLSFKNKLFSCSGANEVPLDCAIRDLNETAADFADEELIHKCDVQLQGPAHQSDNHCVFVMLKDWFGATEVRVGVEEHEEEHGGCKAQLELKKH